MSKKKCLAIIFASSIFITGCSTQKEENKNTNNASAQTEERERVDPDNKPHVEEMECCPKPDEEIKITNMSGTVLSEIQNDKKEKERYLVVDLRTKEEYDKGHVKYAINMPKDEFPNVIGRIRDWSKQPVVLYANNKEELTEVANKLLEDGFTKVYIADGVDEATYEYVTYTNLTGSEMQKIMDKGEDFFIDSRDEKDFKKAHAKNVINVNHLELGDLASKLPSDKDKAIYLYDYTGDRSVVIAEKLQELGYKNITVSIDGTKESQFYFPVKNN